MIAPKQILMAAQTTGPWFSVKGGPAFILLTNHAGGTWNLEAEAPDGSVAEIGGDGGVSFDGDGKVYWHGTPWLRYRLNSGDAGAKAWLCYADQIPGL